jgi:hypothetical protein
VRELALIEAIAASLERRDRLDQRQLAHARYRCR